MPRGAQVIYPKDLGPILHAGRHLPGRPGARVRRRVRRAVDGDAAGRRRRSSATSCARTSPTAAAGERRRVPRRRRVDALPGRAARLLRGHRRDRPRPGRARPARAVAGGDARRAALRPGGILVAYTPDHHPGGPAPRGARHERRSSWPRRSRCCTARGTSRASRCGPTTAWWPTPGFLTHARLLAGLTERRAGEHASTSSCRAARSLAAAIGGYRLGFVAAARRRGSAWHRASSLAVLAASRRSSSARSETDGASCCSRSGWSVVFCGAVLGPGPRPARRHRLRTVIAPREAPAGRSRAAVRRPAWSACSSPSGCWCPILADVPRLAGRAGPRLASRRPSSDHLSRRTRHDAGRCGASLGDAVPAGLRRLAAGPEAGSAAGGERAHRRGRPPWPARR